LTIERYYVGRIQPHSPELLAESKKKLEEMDRVDRERIQLEESRNQVESFIYKLKNELVDQAEEIEKVTNEKQRKELAKLSADAEEWWDDVGYKSDRATAEDKYAELNTPYEKIQLRITESTARPAAMEKLRKKLEEVEKLMEKWSETKPQVTEEERKGILDQVKKIQKWADDNEKKQDKKKSHDVPAFLSTDIPDQFAPLERAVVKLGKRPLPKPKVEKKAANNATDATNSTTTDSANTTTTTTNSTTNATDGKTDNESSSSAGEEKAATSDETTSSADDKTAEDEGKAKEEKETPVADDAKTASEEAATSSEDDKETGKEEL
jgi:hypoxia up-regulated 1